MATLIKTDGTEQTVTPANGKSFNGDELRDFVGGIVDLIELPDGRMLLTKINAKRQVAFPPRNDKGTQLAREAGYIVQSTYELAGDVVVMDYIEAGYELDVQFKSLLEFFNRFPDKNEITETDIFQHLHQKFYPSASQNS